MAEYEHQERSLRHLKMNDRILNANVYNSRSVANYESDVTVLKRTKDYETS